MPTGLSSTSQPSMSRFARRGPCPCLCDGAGGGSGSRACPSFIAVGAFLKVAPYCGGGQQRVDATGLLEAVVGAETQFRSKFEVHAASDLAAQKSLVAIE